MKLKLFKKYFLATSFIIIFSLTSMLMILMFVLNNYIAKAKYESLADCCEKISEYVSYDNILNEDGQLESIVNSLATVSDADIFITDTEGKILVCGCEEWKNQGECFHTDYYIPLDVMERAKNSENLGISTLDIYKNPHCIASKSLEENEQPYATVFAAAPVSMIKGLISTMTKLYLISAVVPIIIMFFAIYLMTYKLTKPLKQMSEASRAMARGDFSRRIPVISDDEIGELSVSFNMMTNSLSQLEGMRKDFVANVSHELKTPMTTISGFIDGILDGTIQPDKQKYYLSIVSDEVKRLSRLVQTMLSMARMESGEFALKIERFDFRELLCKIVIGEQQRIEKQNLNITGLDSIESITVNLDKDLIYQAVYNLVDNAIKFTEQENEIYFKLEKENNKLVFTIKNTGEGIPQNELGMVFERFYKSDKSRSAVKNSTGLGLYIVKTIINAHGGTITVSSKQNEFTAFRVVLPLEYDGFKNQQK